MMAKKGIYNIYQKLQLFKAGKLSTSFLQTDKEEIKVMFEEEVKLDRKE
jgi:hypothetical protein